MRQKSTRLELVESIRSLLQTHAKGANRDIANKLRQGLNQALQVDESTMEERFQKAATALKF